MNHADAELYLRMNDVEGRKGYVMAGLGGKMPEGLEDTFLPPTEVDFKDLKDGDSFDLVEQLWKCMHFPDIHQEAWSCWYRKKES